MKRCKECRKPTNHHGYCDACVTWRKRHPKRVRHRRYGRQWSPREAITAEAQVGIVPLSQIAQSLQRTRQGVACRLYEQGIAPRFAAARTDGMSTGDVRRALGVAKATVEGWIKKGWLVTQWYVVDVLRVQSVSVDALVACLEQYTALSVTRADPDWMPIVARARDVFLAHHISHQDIAHMLAICPTSITHHRTRNQFPAPVVKVGGLNENYYQRAAVRTWLDTHPRYWTSAARATL